MPLARIITLSDRALTDPAEARALPIVAAALQVLGFNCGEVVVGQDAEQLRPALAGALAEADLVVTCGGTGVRPGDCAEQVTRELGPDEVPGVMEEIRRRGAGHTPAALLSRGVCGVVTAGARRVVVLNVPSSRGGARDAMSVLAEVWPHLARDLAGGERV